MNHCQSRDSFPEPLDMEVEGNNLHHTSPKKVPIELPTAFFEITPPQGSVAIPRQKTQVRLNNDL